jgi:spore maturation protein CgeB
MRLLLGMRNKALVVSEPMYKPAPYVPGEHFVMAGSEEEMPALIRHYLAQDEERRRVAECGHAFAVREMSMRQAVRKVVGHLRDWAAGRGLDLEAEA